MGPSASRRTVMAAALVLLALALAGLPGPSAGAEDLPAFCRRLIAHQPAPGVGYVPGVDVRGQPVVPADLPPVGGARPGGTLDTPLTPNLARQMGFALPGAARIPGTAEIGRLSVVGGQAYLDGRPLDGVDDAQLRALCQGDSR